MSQTFDNSYFDGLILSRNTTVDGYKATHGRMAVGELPQAIAASGGRERITVTAGTLHFRPHGADAWQTFAAGTTFEIPAQTQFVWKVEQTPLEYTCVYLDQPAA